MAAPDSSAARVLIVAHRTADSPELLSAVRARAQAGPCRFTLLIPATPSGIHRLMNPEDHGQAEAERRLEETRPKVSAAAGADVEGMVGSHDPVAAVEDALNLVGFDEVILSMLPARVSRWLHLDLPHKVRAMGMPVTEVVAGEPIASPAPAA